MAGRGTATRAGAIHMTAYFVFFFLSGFCGILYELVWMRLAMAQYGVTTALISMVLSAFMAGLGVGSWGGGALLRRHGHRVAFPPLRLYAASEALIGASALLVPLELGVGHRLLAHLAEHASIASGTYYVLSGAWLSLALVPWCACMGATIPLAMFAIRCDPGYRNRRSFSFLYLANVLGAAAGAGLPLYLIELLGFRRTLWVGAAVNAVIAAGAFAWARSGASSPAAEAETSPQTPATEPSNWPLVLLFLTGFSTMGMEVIWIRLFTPYVGPQVYSFAIILGTYLVATFAGSQIYRLWSRRQAQESRLLWVALGVLGLLALVTSDVRVELNEMLRIIAGVAPFAGVVGFLTPMLVDRWSAGDPDRAGRAYAINVLGCIAGPLVAGFVFLPLASEHTSMLLLAVPWLAMAVDVRCLGRARTAAAYGLVAAALAAFFLTQDYTTQFPERQVLRDSTATVIATGTGMQKHLLVNGIGITVLTPVTKMMAHFPLASLDHPPRSILVICFGMGTTFRSAMSWGIPTTALDLVPSVPKMFSYFHADAAQVLASPLAHVVIDDGRRYLERSSEKFDVITIDPPPPITAAASSLLYSQEFYTLIRQHLAPGGILAQWLPEGDAAIQSSVSQALRNSFPQVRVYGSMEKWGWHYFCSVRPLPTRTAEELAARMPARAVADMLEWDSGDSPQAPFRLILTRQIDIGKLVALSPSTPPLTDDRPINEYFLLRLPLCRVQATIPDDAYQLPVQCQ